MGPLAHPQEAELRVGDHLVDVEALPVVLDDQANVFGVSMDEVMKK